MAVIPELEMHKPCSTSIPQLGVCPVESPLQLCHDRRRVGGGTSSYQLLFMMINTWRQAEQVPGGKLAEGTARGPASLGSNPCSAAPQLGGTGQVTLLLSALSFWVKWGAAEGPRFGRFGKSKRAPT